eukprot:gene16696-18390_t
MTQAVFIVDLGLLIGCSVALGALFIALAILLWWFCYKRKKNKSSEQKNYQTRNRRVKIVTKPPKIQVNTIEFTVPTAKENRPQFDEHDNNNPFERGYNSDKSTSPRSPVLSDSSDNVLGIATAYGRLRPDLYVSSDNESLCNEDDYPSGHIGRIWFELQYDCAQEKLFITLIKVKNLPTRQARGSLSMAGSSTCDPSVRICLLPDEKRHLQSKMKKKTRNPHFNEYFAFSISYSILRERTLRFTVFDTDRFMRQTIIGHALYPLKDFDITEQTEEMMDLKKTAVPTLDCVGRIQIALTYVNNQIVTTLSKATNLQHSDFVTLNPYVKISHSNLGKVLKTKKTSVHKETSNPEFDQTFEFKVNEEELERTCFTFEVMHNTSHRHFGTHKDDKLLGRVDIGGAFVSQGKELAHWSKVILKHNTKVKEWYELKH